MLDIKDVSSILEMDTATQNDFFLQCFDEIKNAVSIYDKDGRLLFANKAFCRNFKIGDFEAVRGKNIVDIAVEHGLENTGYGKTISGWKMFDVLKNGETIMNWETRLDTRGSNNMPLYISNDMYPLFNKDGQILGMIEIARNRDQDMKLVKNVVGTDAAYTFDDIVGSSPVMKACIKTAKEYANSPYNFLITGESGVGKELFAQSIHNYSSRRSGPFVALNCAALPEGLIESELFGYVGGAFTGASKNGQMGKFEFANGGTLFLDEIGELPFHFQSKLLRVLETWTVTRIGGTKPTPINVRLVAATNRDLSKMVADGLFRQDLFYRLQVLNVEIPPLRERKEDLITLSEHFLVQASIYSDAPQKTLSAKAKHVLQEYGWPGNVRELKNVINRVNLVSKQDVISEDDLTAAIYSSTNAARAVAQEPDAQQKSLDEIRSDINSSYQQLITEAIRQAGGNKTKAAEILGVSRKTFYRMLERYEEA